MRKPTSWWNVDADARESEATDFLDSIPWDSGALLIGGYAISAYGTPRFSDDVDLVLPFDQRSRVETWLRSGGFRQKLTFGSRELVESLPKLRIERGMVSGDLYFGGVQARGSGARVRYDWLGEGARE